MFGGQTSKNVQDVRMLSLETCLRVLKCFIKCNVLVLVKINVRGFYHVYENNKGVTVREKLPKEQLKCP